MHDLIGAGSGMIPGETEYTLEIRVSQFVESGLYEKVRITNYTGDRIEFNLAFEIESDFADPYERLQDQPQPGRVRSD